MQRLFFQGTWFLTSYGSGDHAGAAFVVRDTTLSTGSYRIARIPKIAFRILLHFASALRLALICS
jgi:hypothetical protein